MGARPANSVSSRPASIASTRTVLPAGLCEDLPQASWVPAQREDLGPVPERRLPHGAPVREMGQITPGQRGIAVIGRPGHATGVKPHHAPAYLLGRNSVFVLR